MLRARLPAPRSIARAALDCPRRARLTAPRPIARTAPDSRAAPDCPHRARLPAPRPIARVALDCHAAPDCPRRARLLAPRANARAAPDCPLRIRLLAPRPIARTARINPPHFCGGMMDQLKILLTGHQNAPVCYAVKLIISGGNVVERFLSATADAQRLGTFVVLDEGAVCLLGGIFAPNVHRFRRF